MWYVWLRFDISALLQMKSQNYASIWVACNCHVEILQNVYYNAWIWQLLWFKFCCCICQYITITRIALLRDTFPAITIKRPPPNWPCSWTIFRLVCDILEKDDLNGWMGSSKDNTWLHSFFIRQSNHAWHQTRCCHWCLWVQFGLWYPRLLLFIPIYFFILWKRTPFEIMRQTVMNIR